MQNSKRPASAGTAAMSALPFVIAQSLMPLCCRALSVGTTPGNSSCSISLRTECHSAKPGSTTSAGSTPAVRAAKCSPAFLSSGYNSICRNMQ
eukprot:16678-Heterococcus_DN1.PRE.4